jgi:hypothetical protein
MTQRETVSISRGNTKTGDVPSVSLPHVITCNRAAPCTRPNRNGARPCYIDKIVRLRPNVRAAYERNLRIWRRDAAQYFGDIAAFLERVRPDYFRFHVSGDFPTRRYMADTFETARRFPAVRFLAFSKRLTWFPDVATLPENYTLVASLWPRWGERPDGYRVAFMTDGTETRAAHALPCPGNCETCGMCWNLPRLAVDVVFKKH